MLTLQIEGAWINTHINIKLLQKIRFLWLQMIIISKSWNSSLWNMIMQFHIHEYTINCIVFLYQEQFSKKPIDFCQILLRSKFFHVTACINFKLLMIVKVLWLWCISSHAMTADLKIKDVAKAAEFFLSDGIIVTGSCTGEEADHEDLKSRIYI